MPCRRGERGSLPGVRPGQRWPWNDSPSRWKQISRVAARTAAEADDQNVSAWLAHAARRQLAARGLGEVIADRQAEHGAFGTTLVEVGFVSVTEMTERALAYPPMGRAWSRLKRLGAMADTDVERLCGGVVAGVRAGKRHVRYPIRARGLAALGESTRKMTEMLLTGVVPRE